ncbi:extracellular mutant protein 11-domain-containing protein [Echria macrotheca]|uniref:Extracellular mutant protein 11-domain-containing protein n=1 Tax=Echria macrotheca TaxID=438768 RepID=A0AAJ0B5I9_9PEZI|nr:extracellular mutant protein 11-domain-containing protein [Echria macrotheca]
MRFSMMPTAKKKLGGIGLFTRQADGTVGGPGASPRPVVGLPTAPPAPQFQLPQLQPPPEIVTARQDVPAPLAIRSIPLPKGGRFATSQSGAATMSLPPAPQPHFHPMQRTRTTLSETGREPLRSPQNAWEDSTVASMFGENDSRPGSDRYRGHPALRGDHLRQHSDAGVQRTHQPTATREHQPQPDLERPFIIGEGGLLKVVSHSAAPSRHGAAPLGTATNADDVYFQEDQQAPDTTPTKPASLALRRTKLPYREPRRESLPAGGYSSDIPGLDLSPERPTDAVNQIERVRLEERMQERARRDRERDREVERELDRDRERERELHHKRSTVFENLTPIPVEDPTFDNTRAAVAPTGSSNVSPKSVSEAVQRTPRAPRGPLPSLPLPAKVGNINLTAVLAEAPMGRAASRRLKEPTAVPESKKRPLSPDYNDAELHAMSYADLRAQAFDYDPQQAAIREQQQHALALPLGGSLEERLKHYRSRDLDEKRQLFASMSIDEWDEAGDWFLAQFSDVMARIRKGRREKRQMVERFEAEVAAREEAVRGKTEGIAKTLADLREEGQTMMEGKDMDLDA